MYSCTRTHGGLKINATLIMHYSVFFGSRPAYVLADMDLFQEITVKQFDKFMDRLVRDIPIWNVFQVSCNLI